MAEGDPSSRTPTRVRGAAVVFVAAVALGGVWLAVAFVRHERAVALDGWQARLSAMADERGRAIEQWLAQRDGELHLIATFPTARYLVDPVSGRPLPFPREQGTESHLSELLGHAARTLKYRGLWMVRDQTTLAASPGARRLTPLDLELARRVADGRDALGGLTRTSGSVSVLLATWVEGDNPRRLKAGLVVAEVDPWAFLYPLLAAQASASETGETVLVARDGDFIVFLAPLRHESLPPLEGRRPFATPGLDARAALTADAAFGEFVDYRGVRVLAATRRIRTRPWGLVVKVDRDEALAAFRAETGLLAAVLGFAVVAVVGIVASVRRADRYRAQMELVQSHARFATLLDQAEDVIFFLDAHGRFLEANRRAEVVYGYTREELRGMLARELRPVEARAEVDARVAQTLTEGAARFEAIHQRKDGTRFPVEVNARRVEAGGQSIIVAIVRDMTEWKRQQAALEESRAKLADAERQLLEAQKLEAVGRLAAGIAHDFNNLLTVIGGYARLVAGSLPVDDPRRGDMEEVVRAADRAASLTRQLLAFGRRQRLEPRVLDLNAVVAGVAQMLERLIGDDVRLVVRPSAALGRVELDEGQFQQVLMNLAVNARDAMPEGGTLTIETADVTVGEGDALDHAPVPPGAYVVVRVTDTGVGMDADTQARIFEPFFTTKPEGQGTGLGLSTVYGIVKQSGGYIRVASRPNAGTTFTLYFPRTEGSPAETPAGEAAATTAPARGETVLVVEDQATVRDMVRRVLAQHGYRVQVAANGEEALAQIERDGAELDLLVTDLVMPGMSGLALWQRTRALRPELRVIFVSGYSQEATGRTHLPDGAKFLAKPFTPQELLEAVEQVFGRERPAR